MAVAAYPGFLPNKNTKKKGFPRHKRHTEVVDAGAGGCSIYGGRSKNQDKSSGEGAKLAEERRSGGWPATDLEGRGRDTKGGGGEDVSDRNSDRTRLQQGVGGRWKASRHLCMPAIISRPHDQLSIPDRF